MRSAVVAALLAACGARLGGGAGGSDNPADALGRQPLDRCAPSTRGLVRAETHAWSVPKVSASCMFTTPVDVRRCEGRVHGDERAPRVSQETRRSTPSPRQFVGSANTFIGATDRAVEGTFVWDDGTPLSFTNWRAGEPNNGGSGATYQEDCVIIAGARVEQAVGRSTVRRERKSRRAARSPICASTLIRLRADSYALREDAARAGRGVSRAGAVADRALAADRRQPRPPQLRSSGQRAAAHGVLAAVDLAAPETTLGKPAPIALVQAAR